MSENVDKQETIVPVPVACVVRLTSHRTPAYGADHGNHEPGSSGGEGVSCFVNDWLEDVEEEVLLHRTLDALEEDKSDEANKELTTGHFCTCTGDHADAACSEAGGSSNHGRNTVTHTLNDKMSTELEGSSLALAVSKDGGLQSEKETRQCKKCQASKKRKAENTLSRTELDLNTFKEMGLPQYLWKMMKTSDCGGESNNMTPLRRLKGRCLWVSDLMSQEWCERQLVYDCTFEGPLELLETPAMKVGHEMHLKRELEVHDIKKIAVKTKEDKWAIKCLNILSSIRQLLDGRMRGGESPHKRVVVREMPIFGRPFQGGPFLVGVIDEIRLNSKEQLELVEFKTRVKKRSVPGNAQRKTHKLQVMLYKQLFDEAVCGLLERDTILDTIGLDPNAVVSDEVAEDALAKGLNVTTFGDYLDIMLERFQFLSKVDNLFVEYSSQDDGEPFAVDDCDFDPVWLKERLDYYSAFWEGRREVKGVDVEEAWKCNFCNFVDECDWRKKMHKECLNRRTASVSRVKIELTD